MSDKPIPKVPVVPYLQFLYTSRIELAPPLVVGQSACGERRIIPITGGAFEGPRLRGRVLMGGADWQIVRRDGVVEVDARYTLETDDGALIYIRNNGLRHGPPEILERIASGDTVHPSEYYFRTMPVFETGSPAYAWLNRLVCVAAGERRPREVIITVYEVT